MCDPVTMAGIAIAGSAVQAYSGYQQANAANRAAEQQAQVQADEYAASRDQQIAERVKQARRERGRLRVAAGEAGVGGASVEAQLANSFGQQNQDIAIIQKQGGFTERAIGTELKSVAARNRFSPLSAGLQIAGAGASAYSAAGGTYGKKTT